MDVRSALNQAARDLENAGIPSPRLDAEVLMAFCLGRERLELYKYPDLILDERHLVTFRSFVARRKKWEPVAYITGFKDFWSCRLEVNKSVLIPRPETEIIVEEALNLCRLSAGRKISILDVGTGSGAIAIAMAKELSHARVVATDISAAALAVAAHNARQAGLAGKIDFREGNLFEPVDGFFDIIISNPPYIAAEEYAQLPAGVRDFEPREALLAGPRGTEFYELLINQAIEYLPQAGWLLLEIGATQEAAVSGKLKAAGRYDEISHRADYAGYPRVIRARRKS